MKNIPMFTTENGVASLILEKIPYCADAYVCVLDSLTPEQLLQECADFCIMAGAKNVYITGANIPVKYPLVTEIWTMQYSGRRQETDACLVPVDGDSADQWKTLYNDRMATVPAAAFMSPRKMDSLLKSGNAYFVYKNDLLIGIGAVSDSNIDCIASVVPGAGKETLWALTKAITLDKITLEVASKNLRAVSFYERMGFVKTNVKEIWYQYVK